MNKTHALDDPNTQNPYLAGSEGKAAWNDRYGNMTRAIQCWKWTSLAMMGVSLVLSGALVKVATTSKVEPFVVETNQGIPYAVKHMSKMNVTDQRLINYVITQFIINARGRTSDVEAETARLKKVYALSADNTLPFLQEHFEKNNPLQLGATSTISVTIVNALSLGHHTWQVTWDETERRTQGGDIIKVTRWMGDLNYRFSDVNPEFVNDNPIGLYVTDVSWAQSQTTPHA